MRFDVEKVFYLNTFPFLSLIALCSSSPEIIFFVFLLILILQMARNYSFGNEEKSSLKLKAITDFHFLSQQHCSKDRVKNDSWSYEVLGPVKGKDCLKEMEMFVFLFKAQAMFARSLHSISRPRENNDL